MRRALPLIAATAAVLLLAGCASAAERASDAIAEQAADRIADDMTPAGRIFDVSGAYLVSEYVHDAGVTALSWRGSSGDQAGDGARVVIRVHVERSFHPSDTIFGQDGETADLTRCFELAVRTWRYYDTSTVTDVACPDVPAPPQPTGVRPDELPADARDRLTAILRDAADPADAAQLVRRGFPAYVTVDAVAWQGGIVVAVGAPAVRDCLVGRRTAAGAVDLPNFRRIWAQPGELGCTAQLVTNPPQ